MKSLFAVAALAATMSISVPAYADDYADCCRNCEAKKNRDIAENCSGMRDRALATCRIKYEKSASQCLAGCSQVRDQNAAYNQIRANKDAAIAAARAKRAAQTPN